jgi:hypothetical protein
VLERARVWDRRGLWRCVNRSRDRSSSGPSRIKEKEREDDAIPYFVSILWASEAGAHKNCQRQFAEFHHKILDFRVNSVRSRNTHM